MTTNNAINLLSSNKNLIIGGNFTTNPWQRQITFVSPIDNQYTADMFCWTTAGSGVVTISKVSDSPTTAQAGIHSRSALEVSVTTADASLAASDRYALLYRMEGFDWLELAERSCTLSFWIRSNKSGTFCVSLGNLGGDRSYVAEFIYTASGWTFIKIPIPSSPSAGTWNFGNDIGVKIRWILAAGTDFQTTAGTWQTGNFFCSSNQANIMDTNANFIRLALIQIESGITATPYSIENEVDTLLKSQRYYFKTYNVGSVPGTSTANGATSGFSVTNSTSLASVRTPSKVNMRTTPTVTWFSTTGASGNVRNLTAGADAAVSSTSTANETSAGYPILTGAATADNLYGAHVTLDASL